MTMTTIIMTMYMIPLSQVSVLLPREPLILMRMKGVLCVNGSDQRYVFQGVHSTLDGCPGGTWGPEEKKINKLVFIGRNLDETSLRKGFRGCLA
ncbi:hypothetical protein ACLB2K_045155 [Fragaria x ananassa]